MLKMDQVHVIRHKVLVEGQSRREVAKEMGVSRNTVRKYTQEGASEPKLCPSKEPRGRPVLDKVQGRIDEIVMDGSSRTTKKQRITATRVHEKLISEGLVVSESTVRKVVREWRRLETVLGHPESNVVAIVIVDVNASDLHHMVVLAYQRQLVDPLYLGAKGK